MKKKKTFFGIIFASFFAISCFMTSACGSKEVHKNPSLVSGQTPTCIAPGYKDAWICGECGKYFSAESLAEDKLIGDISAYSSWKLADGKLNPTGNHSDTSKIFGQSPTCLAAGWKDYYKCNTCEQLFENEDGTSPISNLEVWKHGTGKLNPIPHSTLEIPGKASTCTEPGYKSSWQCSMCEQYFEEQSGTTLIGDALDYAAWTLTDGMLAPHSHNHPNKVNGQAPTCVEAGYKDAWTCGECEQYFSENTLSNDKLIGDDDDYELWKLTDGKLNPTGVHKNPSLVSGQAPTCVEAGYNDAWTCGECEQYFSAESLAEDKLIGDDDDYELWKLTDGKLNPTGAHKNPTLVPGLAPTTEAPGYKDAWTCGECEQYFSAESLAIDTLIGDKDDYAAWKLGDGKIDPLDPVKEDCLLLDKNNYATVEEVGTFDNPIYEDKIAIRETELGDDITLQFCSGRGITNNDTSPTTHDKFCQMPGSQYGWITNKDPLAYVTKIELIVSQSAAVFRFDMSENHTLEEYYYTEKPPYVSYRSQEYTGSTTYQISFTGAYKYFRIQNIGSSHLSLISMKIHYCSSITPITYRGELRTNATPIPIIPINVKLGGKITVDYRYVDPVKDANNGVSLFFGSDETNCFGNYKIFYNRLAATYNGVTFSTCSDGYYRMTIDVTKLDKVPVECAAPTNINQISFKWFEPTEGVYFDIKSEPAKETYRGDLYKGTSTPIKLSKTYTVSEGGTIIVDYKYANPIADANNGVSLFFGSDETNCFGNYKIFYNRLNATYNGITFATLDDGYNRLTVNVAELDKVRAECIAPTSITQISFKWFEPTEGVYFDVNPQDKPIKTTEFTMKDSDFVVAIFPDVHVTDESMISETGTTGKTIRYGIENTNPDIIIFTGDIVGLPRDLDYFCDFIDTFEIPYFFILGNHDHEGSLNYDSMAPRINQSKYGYIEKGPDNLNSQGNYVIKINNSDGDLVHGFVMMDTGNKYTVTDDSLVEYVHNPVSGVPYGSFNSRTTYCASGWNGLRGNQITWYEDTVEELDCETTLFVHIPFLEYVKAYEQYKDAVNKGDWDAINACEPIGHCNMGETSCGSIENLGIFNSILAKDSTKNVICGHDHVNDFSLLYQGVRLTYALKTGEGSYWKEDGTICGYTTLTINNLGHGSVNQIYYNPLNH